MTAVGTKALGIKSSFICIRVAIYKFSPIKQERQNKKYKYFG